MTRTLSLKDLRYPITSIIIKRSVIFNHISVMNYYTFIVPKELLYSILEVLTYISCFLTPIYTERTTRKLPLSHAAPGLSPKANTPVSLPMWKW